MNNVLIWDKFSYIGGGGAEKLARNEQVCYYYYCSVQGLQRERISALFRVHLCPPLIAINDK